nr:unnamed protein product [Leishmania braziliensis]
MDNALGKLPATRWDRLVAVLEENEPERAIDALRILEQAKKLNLSDFELFYLLLKRYQERQPRILIDVVSLYAMMSTWMEWIVQVQCCLDAQRNKMDASSSFHTAKVELGSVQTSSDLADYGQTLPFPSSNNSSSRLISSNPVDSSTNGDNGCGSQLDSPVRASHNGASSTLRGLRRKSDCRSLSTRPHLCFELGPGWKWDGLLDFLRNGRVLSCLVEEALGLCGKLEALQDHLSCPETLSLSTDEILHPSPTDMNRVIKDVAIDGATGGASANESFSPQSYLSTLDSSQLSCSRRGNVKLSKTLKMIEEQRKNLAATEQWVRKLNDMCERFLGWERSAHNNSVFFDLCNLNNFVRPLHSDDAHLLYRLHWLAVALYRVVNDPSIIPAPPRMSFIVCRDDLSGLLDTSEEDNEIDLLVAAKRSCLPLKTRLSVTMKDASIMQLHHPDMKASPRLLRCALVKGDVFVYFEEYHAFVPVWSVFQYFIQHLDELTWRFEVSREEREQEQQVLGTTLSLMHGRLGATDDFTVNNGGATFDLTIRSSTVRHNRQRRPSEAPSNTQSMWSSTTPNPFDLLVDCKAPVTVLPRSFSHRSVTQAGTGIEGDIAVAKALLSRMSTSSSHSAEPSLSSHSSPNTTRPDYIPLPPLNLATGEGITNKSYAVSSTTDGASTAAAPSASASGIGIALNAINPPVSDSSTSAYMVSPLAPKLWSEARDESAEDQGPLSRETATLMVERKDTVECDCNAGVISNDAAPMTSSCAVSCTPTPQVVVAREAHLHYGIDALNKDEELISDATMTLMSSGSYMSIRNFTASVFQESEPRGIALFPHRFRVSSGPIGKGAFGAVYKALNLDTGRIVAVKQSRYSYDDNTADLNWREFRMWSMLPPHPSVITFYGASREVDTHQLLLVMEYASGGSIVQLYRQFWPIPESLFYDHALGIARGLKHLHDYNVIHGDVKPENVLTRSDGSVAISDFGCSRFSLVGTDSDSSSFRSSLRESGSLLLFGTAAYMAPEVILNEPHLKSDVWAYACTLLQLWLREAPWSTGERCFSALDAIPLMFYIATEEVVPFTTEQLERSPGWLQRIAQRAFERSVERRCSMAEIISILGEHRRSS